MQNEIICGDCLEVMDGIPNKSVDMILCDLPYGVLNKGNPNAKWDSVISFDDLWKQYNRVIKDNGAIVLFAQGMFTAKLMLSNEKMWRYNLIWRKSDRPSGFLNARRMPLREHEDICVFYKSLPTYNPQMIASDKLNHSRGNHKIVTNRCYGDLPFVETYMDKQKFPKSILEFPRDANQSLHPTQKPVDLCEYLIKTYSNEGDLVLDNCMGSGATCLAAKNLGRQYIGIEKDEKYYEIAKKRIENE